MSLMNDMLKNLEQRDLVKRHVPEIPLFTPTQTHFNLSKQHKLYAISTGITVIIFTFIGMGYFLLRLPALNQLAQFPNVNVSHRDLPANVITAAKHIKIMGVTLQVKDNNTEVSFLLSEPALYRVISNREGNKIGIVIENVQMQTQLPTIADLHTAISNFTANVEGENLRFNIDLFPNTVIKSIHLNEDKKNPALIVTAAYVTDNKNTADIKNIKTEAWQSILGKQYQLALSAAESGNYQAAITSLSNILNMDPSYKDARVSLAALLIDQGHQISKATQIIDEGITLSPDYLPLLELKARILTSEGKIESALALLQRSLPSIQENPDYHAFIAALEERLNRNTQAANIYKQLLNINAHNSQWWLGLGTSLEKLGEKDQAKHAYTRALAEGNLNVDSQLYTQKRLSTLKEDSND